jgi:hypothetical protein
VHQAQLFESTKDIYLRVFRRLCPRMSPPEISIHFKAYRNANCYIRWKNQQIEVRHADALQSAPAHVTEAIAYILLARLYRKPVPEQYLEIYRTFMNDPATRDQIESLRRSRGRKILGSSQGRHYNLDELFDEVNNWWFGGTLPRPKIGWTLRPSVRVLGHYDPVHHAIAISSFLDSEESGIDLVRYVMFHEMLHIKYPIRYREGRREIHGREFREEEALYPGFQELKKKLERLCAKRGTARTHRRRRRS